MSNKPERVGFSAFAMSKVTLQELAAKEVGSSSTVSELEPPGSQATEPEMVSTTSFNTKQEVVLAGKDCSMKESDEFFNGLDEFIEDIIANEKGSSFPTPEVEVVSATDSMCLDEKPLSACAKEAQTPPLVFESGEASLVSELLSPEPGDKGEGKMIGQDFVFVKKSPFWQEVESMEVFRALPQKPHFRPLLNHKEWMREGLALGYTIAFATLVQKASKLEIEDPVNRFTYILDPLPELVIQGFDVASLKLRVEKLKSLKESQIKLLEQSKASASECEEHSQVLTKIKKVIEDIDKKIKSLQERRACLVSEEEKLQSEFVRAQEEANRANQGIEHMREEFARLGASPL